MFTVSLNKTFWGNKVKRIAFITLGSRIAVQRHTAFTTLGKHSPMWSVNEIS
jgi:hypothetical protein